MYQKLIFSSNFEAKGIGMQGILFFNCSRPPLSAILCRYWISFGLHSDSRNIFWIRAFSPYGNTHIRTSAVSMSSGYIALELFQRSDAFFGQYHKKRQPGIFVENSGVLCCSYTADFFCWKAVRVDYIFSWMWNYFSHIQQQNNFFRLNLILLLFFFTKIRCVDFYFVI